MNLILLKDTCNKVAVSSFVAIRSNDLFATFLNSGFIMIGYYSQKNDPKILIRICSKFIRKWSKRTDCSKIKINDDFLRKTIFPDFPCIPNSIYYIYHKSSPNNLIDTVLLDLLHTEPLRRLGLIQVFRSKLLLIINKIILK